MAGDLWARFSFEEPVPRLARFLHFAAGPFKRLIESLILHPRTVIPTEDFLSLLGLIEMIGERNVISLLEEGRIQFIRLRGGIGYVGGGRGLSHFHIGSPTNPGVIDVEPKTAMDRMFALFNYRPSDPKLRDSVLNSLQEYSAEPLAEMIRAGTLLDAFGTDELRPIFSIEVSAAIPTCRIYQG